MPEQAAELLPSAGVLSDDERPDLSVLAALELPEEDGEPLENHWHYLQAALLRDVIARHWHGRADFFIGVNMFVFYSVAQAQTLEFRGPDLFVVRDVDGTRSRKHWVVWAEGRQPELVVELLSPRTRAEDLGRKKAIYERDLGVAEYVCYGPDPTTGEGELEFYVWRLAGSAYQAVAPNERGWIWSEVLGAWLGVWEGVYGQIRAPWLRLYDQEGRLVPTDAEVAEAERRRVEAAEQRLAELEAELARLRAQLSKAD